MTKSWPNTARRFNGNKQRGIHQTGTRHCKANGFRHDRRAARLKRQRGPLRKIGKQKFEQLQDKVKQREEADKAAKADAELTQAIVSVFGDKQFTSEYVKKGLIEDMKAEIAKPENKGKGYAELFESLTKDKDGIFANPNPPADMAGMNPNIGGGQIWTICPTPNTTLPFSAKNNNKER